MSNEDPAQYKELFEITPANGSSPEQLKAKLVAPHHTIEFCVTVTWTIYLHHSAWHEKLRADQGLQDSDILFEGNLSHYSTGPNGPYFAIRLKSTKGANPRRAMEDHRVDMIYWRAAELVIKEYLEAL